MSEIFNSIASRYDTPEREFLANIISTRVKKELLAATDSTMLDYGGGTGLVSLPLRDSVKQLTIMDSSEQMILQAEAKIKQINLTNVLTKVGNIMVNPVEEQYDLVLLSLVLLHIPDSNSFFNTIQSVLKDNGKLIIIDFIRNKNVNHPKVHSGFEKESLEELMNNSGLKLESFDSFHDGEKIFMGQDATLFISIATKID